MVTIQSQNFGVEIEMTGVSRGTAASVIANYFGVGGIHFAGGTYQTYEAKDSKGRVYPGTLESDFQPVTGMENETNVALSAFSPCISSSAAAAADATLAVALLDWDAALRS